MPVTLHCPHCAAALPPSSASTATRCPACRLIVGAGRALTAEQADHRVENVGGRSGTIASAARSSGARSVDADDVHAALQEVACKFGVRVERLRLADYDTACRTHPALPSVGEVLATFGGWKRARAGAARPGAGEASEGEPRAGA